MSKEGQDKIHEMITEKVLALLDQGVIPWRKTWKGSEAPQNMSGRQYHGINAWLLAVQAQLLNYTSPKWGTFNQIKAAGGSVRKGERSFPVVLWKPITKENAEGEKKTFFFLRYFNVFNLCQCDGITVEETEAGAVESIEEADQVVIRYFGQAEAPALFHGGDRAFYTPAKDSVTVPFPADFEGAPAYYSTLFHEMAHSTGHSTRLDREGIRSPSFFGSHEYSKEELVAEMSAAFLCGRVGIETRTLHNSAAYIQSWRSKLSTDKRIIISAASQADKAVRFIIGEKQQEESAQE